MTDLEPSVFPPDFDWTLYEQGGLVVSNFVVSDGGMTIDSHGSSRGISNELDRHVLKRLRSVHSAVLVGGQTARVENYTPSTRYETYVLTRNQESLPTGLNVIQAGSSADLKDKIQIIASHHGGLLVEAGPSLLKVLSELRLIDRVFLTLVKSSLDPEVVARQKLGLIGFELVLSQTVQDTRFTVLDSLL